MDEAAGEVVVVNGMTIIETITRAKCRKDDKLTTMEVHTENCSTLMRVRDPTLVNSAKTSRHRQPEDRRQQFAIHKDQTTVAEAASDSPNEVPKKVDSISITCRILYLPAAANLPSQLNNSLSVGQIFADVAYYLAVTRVYQLCQIYTCNIRPMRQGISNTRRRNSINQIG